MSVWRATSNRTKLYFNIFLCYWSRTLTPQSNLQRKWWFKGVVVAFGFLALLRVCLQVCVPGWRDKRNYVIVAEVSGHFGLAGGASSCSSTGSVLQRPERGSRTGALNEEGRRSVAPTGQYRSSPFCPGGLLAWGCRQSAEAGADDIREVVFQIGFPALPAASGANSTGRITQVAGQARGMWPQQTQDK